jgi:hypothetical protein
VTKNSISLKKTFIQLCTPCKYLFFVLAYLFLSACSDTYQLKPSPVARQGVLDLTQWDFEKDGVIALNGEWGFHWEQLLAPSDFPPLGAIKQQHFVKVPSSWNSYQVDGEALGGQGYATYHLRIIGNQGNTKLMFRSTWMGSSYNLFINGELISSNGVVAKNREKMTPQYMPLTSSYSADSDSLEVVLQVANFYHAEGGAWYPIEIGLEQQITKTREGNLAINLFLCGGIFIMGIYYLGLYSFRRKEKSSLLF